MRASAAVTQGNVARLAPVAVTASAAVPVAAYGGFHACPVVLTVLSRVGTVPYLEQIVTGGVYALFTGTGVVFALSLVATAYSAVR